MRRLFLFAVLWTALFGSGHVLAACPMGQSGAGAGVHSSPCHSEEGASGQQQGGATHATTLGHDCCALLAPSGAAVAKAVDQKSSLIPANDTSSGDVALGWGGQVTTHPPPLFLRISNSYSSAAGLSGADTFLRTGRLRL